MRRRNASVRERRVITDLDQGKSETEECAKHRLAPYKELRGTGIVQGPAFLYVLRGSRPCQRAAPAISDSALTFPDIALLNAGTSSVITFVYSAFAALRSDSICASTSSDVSVGLESAPPATSPAPVPTSPESQIRFR